MALAIDDQQDGDFADVLDEVTLKFFKANPTAILPFGASTLSWAVEGPQAGFHVRLNRQIVTRKGERVVQPTATATYSLSAHAGQASRTLGTVQVSVDRASCETYDIGNPQSAMQAPIRLGVKNSGDLYFRSDPGINITFTPGSIHIKLQLKKNQNNFPDPDVDINASFGLAIRDGELEPRAEQISVDVRFPAWVWLIPGAQLPLAIAIDMAKESGSKRMHETIGDITQLLAFNGLPPPGKRRSTVRIDDGNNGAGVVEFTACSSSLLVKFADISVAGVLQQHT